MLALLLADCVFAFFALQHAGSAVDFLFLHSGILGLLLCPLLAGYYLLRPQADRAVSASAIFVILLLLLGLALLLGGIDANLLRQALDILHRRFYHPSWQALGLILAAVVYLPLIARKIGQKLRARQQADLAVCGAFLLFIVGLYLPFGFNSVAHWESWSIRAYLENQHSWSVQYELSTRFWAIMPHLLANIIAPDSFAGYHLTHLLMIWAKMTLLYGILRLLGFSRPLAFLTSLLFMVYPVNSGLLSLRSLSNQFSVMSLLAAVYWMLEYRRQPSVWRLLGLWLGLIFNVASNETAYILILFAPALWLASPPRASWRKAHLTVIWYLFPAGKIAHLLLLASLNMRFYNSYVLDSAASATGLSFDALVAVIPQLAQVYQHTFLGGWQAALSLAVGSDWLALSLGLCALAGAFYWHLLRKHDSGGQLGEAHAKSSIVWGLLFVPPAVGMLIWLPQYSGDLWRMYFYVPIGAALALVGLARLLVAGALPQRYRMAALGAICLVLMLPATARLLEQHDALVRQAHKKARLLNHLIETVPHIKAGAVILLTTDMSKAELAASAVSELRISKDLDNGMLYVLYGNGVPVQSTFCIDENECSAYGDEQTIFTSDSPELLQRTLALNIHADLSVTLIENPAEYFGLEQRAPYDVSLLYDRDAVFPPRARSMLASVRSGGADDA